MTNAVHTAHRFFYFLAVLFAPAAAVDLVGNLVGRGIGDARTVFVVALAVGCAHVAVELTWRWHKRRHAAVSGSTKFALVGATLLSSGILAFSLL